MTMLEAPPQVDPPAIDPRLRQRWVDARREEGRRRLRVLAALASVVLLAGAALGGLHSPLVRVRHLRVVIDAAAVGGAPAGAQLSQGQVVAQACFAGRRLMVDVNSSQAETLIDQLPWAADARVVRQWPGTVRITVTARTAVGEVALSSPTASDQSGAHQSGGHPSGAAAAGNSAAVNPAPPGGVALVDVTGRVLERDATAPPGLPVLGSLPVPGAPGTWVGVTANGGAASQVLAVAAALPPKLAAKIWTVEMGSQGLQLTIGTTAVLFGDISQLADKVAALGVVVDQVPLAGVATVDLRVPDRPALTRSSLTANLSTTAGG
jgi:cell division septal protein FtsQ